jgi:O-antigen ligase
LAVYCWRVHSWTFSKVKFFRILLHGAYGLLLLAGMYLTYFRNVWCGFLGGYLTRYLFSSRGRASFLIGLAFLGLVVAAGWGEISSSQLYQERIKNVDNIYDRLGAWLYSLRAFSEHPLVGIGYGQIKRYIYAAQDAGDDLRVMDIPATFHPHNTLIAMLGENGIVLTVPFLMVGWYFLGHVRGCFRFSRSSADREFALFAVSGTVAMLVPHISDRCLTWDKYNILLLLFFALVAARHAKLQKSAHATAPESLTLNEAIVN